MSEIGNLVYEAPPSNGGEHELSVWMALNDVNILAATDTYVLYEFGFIAPDTGLKKWAKRLAPLELQADDVVRATYMSVAVTVGVERDAISGGGR